MRRLILPLCFIAAAAAVCGSPAVADELGAEAGDTYTALSLMPRSASSVIVCHGFGCRDRTEIALSATDRSRLTQILGGGHSSPAAERRAIASAIAWFDRRVGPEAGTVHHMARAGHDQMGDADHQFDCIDASSNTTTLLHVLDELHLLKFHRVEEIVARGAFIDLRWPHATAVVSDLKTQKEWAINSWTHAYGEKPDVKPLQVWLQEGGF